MSNFNWGFSEPPLKLRHGWALHYTALYRCYYLSMLKLYVGLANLRLFEKAQASTSLHKWSLDSPHKGHCITAKNRMRILAVYATTQHNGIKTICFLRSHFDIIHYLPLPLIHTSPPRSSWYVITCPCPWWLLRAPKYSYTYIANILYDYRNNVSVIEILYLCHIHIFRLKLPRVS